MEAAQSLFQPGEIWRVDQFIEDLEKWDRFVFRIALVNPDESEKFMLVREQVREGYSWSDLAPIQGMTAPYFGHWISKALWEDYEESGKLKRLQAAPFAVTVGHSYTEVATGKHYSIFALKHEVYGGDTIVSLDPPKIWPLLWFWKRRRRVKVIDFWRLFTPSSIANPPSQTGVIFYKPLGYTP